MKRELITTKGAIIPVTAFTIPTPIRGFGWAVRTTFATARRFWEDTEEVRWLACNVAGGLLVLTLLFAKGIGVMLDAGCSVAQKARHDLASAWRFREELIAEWA